MKLFRMITGVGMVFFCLINPALAKHRIHRSHASHHSRTRVVAPTPVRQVDHSPMHNAANIFGTPQLNNELSNIIANANSNANVAVYVKSMKYGDALYARNIYQPLTPASTMKILTAEAALLYLGPEYHFSTQLLTDAKSVKNGVLQGNLYVVLSGDPSLTYNDLYELMQTLRSHQITSIGGNVYIDNTAYDQSFYGPGWEWRDKKYCYAAPISASIINHNCLSFQVTPSQVPGQSAQVVGAPKDFYPEIRNSIITTSGRSRACSVRLSTDESEIGLDGCIPRGHPWGIGYVVTDIPDYNRALFKSVLSQQGVNVYGRITFGSAPDDLSIVSTHTSKPLRGLINEMLKKSDNIIAGALFKKLGQLYTHQPGSWQNGSVAVTQILSKHAGVNIDGMRILDGSGLSADNLTTPSQMMQVLDFAYHHYGTSYEFISSLPIAGVDGTLKHRMGNIARKVRAKTGTISGVVSLAGYVVSGDKEPLAFVIMINGMKGMGWRYKSLEDRIATALTKYKRVG